MSKPLLIISYYYMITEKTPKVKTSSAFRAFTCKGRQTSVCQAVKSKKISPKRKDFSLFGCIIDEKEISEGRKGNKEY